jgi:microcystin-dependent protein
MVYGAYIPGEQLPAADANKGFVPIGTVLPFAGGSAPSNWIFCYGQSLARSGTYADLFAVIGTAFGAADGSHFNVPDMRGNVPLGEDNMGGSSRNRVTDADADTLGGQDGSETHTLTTAEIPSHTHGYPNQTVGGSSPASFVTFGSANIGPVGENQWSATGGGGAHNNMPPYIALNYIIRY